MEKTATLRAIRISAAAPDNKQAPGNERGTADASTGKSGDELLHNRAHFEEVVNKGLDLAEAGIGIGFDVVARLGSILKGQVLDKIGNANMLNPAMGNHAAGQGYADNRQAPENPQHHGQTGTSPAQSPGDTAQNGGAAPGYYLFNRLPLFPGAEAALPFSINNDSLTADKMIRIGIEGFVGEARQAVLDAGTFSVTPNEIAIAPADFEKFVLKGTIPAAAPADNYRGWLVLSEQGVYRIPVVLSVSDPGQPAPGRGTPV
ncbi:MAG: hypothetical protein EPN14_09320 [Gallionella sp.]|nr:MAG: hypothetical protein EPN14_09320 [Gallionella sp.]